MGNGTKLVSTAPSDREIFLGALERTAPAERAAYLETACAGDTPRRQRIEALLAEQDALGGFLESPAWSGQRPASPTPGDPEALAEVTEKPGDLIGPYKLLQQIGEGGCGVVYMAEQEHPVRRRVALKVIKLGMDTRNVIARFEAERQALAMMDHPHIARVLDAGATVNGRPYFVMELVRGIRITDYCEENDLPTADRLRLFIQVCHALQHAHQKGIIHRDIKPSNILVTLVDGVPVPKVIDFGIAKATEQRLTDKTLFTAFATFIGTPAYMSPEQAAFSGLDIDTRSDIYALGVLLYELLVGRTPFDAETLMKSGLDECRRTIREVDPPRPSTRLKQDRPARTTGPAASASSPAPLPHRHPHALDPDLDWITMKCLEKDRARRYASAHDLAMDVQRYLDDEPVQARPPSNVYRLGKLLHRHRTAFAAIGAVAVTLIVGSTFSAWQAFRATRAERSALTAQRREARLRQQAELGMTAARFNEYVADINLAHQSLAAGNHARAIQLLDKHRPTAGSTDSDLRGFEWRHLWQICRGDPHDSLPRLEGTVASLAVAPTGNRLAVGLRQGLRESISVWDSSTRSLVTNFARGAGSLAFSPDGSRLLSAGIRSAHLWNTADWTVARTFQDAASPAALSRDGTRLAATSREGVRVWDTATGRELRRIPGAWAPLAFSPDGRTLASEAATGLVLWPIDASQTERVLRDSTNLFSRPPPGADVSPRPGFRPREDRALIFSPDGRWVIAGRNTLSEHGVFVLSIWDARTGEPAGTLPADAEHIEHAGAISALAFSPDGRILASASLDRSIRLWEFDKRQPLAALQGHRSEVQTVGFTSDGRTVVSGSRGGEVKFWPVRPPRKEDVITGVRHPLAFSADSRTLVAQTRDGSAVVWVDATTGETLRQFELEQRRGRFGAGAGQGVFLSADLATLALRLGDGSVKAWNTATHDPIPAPALDSPADLLALAPDGRTLLTRQRDGGLRWWDLRHGTNSPWAVEASRAQFSGNGRVLATLGRGNDIQIWDAATLQSLARIELEDAAFPGFGWMVFALSQDGALLAVAGQDDEIHLHDTRTGRSLGVCSGHKQSIRSLAVSPDGKTLASSSEDGTLKLWHVATRQELLTVRQLGATLSGLLFSPDGRLLVGGSGAFSQTGGLRFLRAPSLSETDAAAANPPHPAIEPNVVSP